MKIHSNSDLFNRRAEGGDQLFIVASQPQPISGGYTISIAGNRPAAVLQRHAKSHDQPYTVEQVRHGLNQDHWLLSGGVLLTDHLGRMAIGLRDGNGPDPFVFTNIGAGRCDGKFIPHCLRELAEELILCLYKKEHWIQVSFSPETPSPLLSLLRKKSPAIYSWNRAINPTDAPEPLESTGVTIKTPNHPKNISHLRVEWTDMEGTSPYSEELYGYLYLDPKNHTLEFRLPRILNLGSYRPEDTAIFFAEGTGYARWCSKEELKKLVAAKMTT
ncbi:MAG: hypothetical protein OEV64_10940, partial [Desulfobulbaceae bacterium]|nr:hypothetical protein [Desulfobulbaceae bacterium]